MDKFDVCIAGAGVIGLAVAFQLSESTRFKTKKIVVTEREASFGHHISSRNSEVVHAGIYYPTDSLKARLCVRGNRLLYEHCRRYDVPYHMVGKYIVAQEANAHRLTTLQDQAVKNGVSDLIWINGNRLKTEEPAIKGDYALFSPSTGILDSHSFMQSLLYTAQNSGVMFAPYTQIQSVTRSTAGFILDACISNGKSEQRYVFQAEYFINCAGLDANHLAKNIDDLSPAHIPRVHMCKGDYFNYSGSNPFNHLVYPIPERNTQGLGIHSTMDMAGNVRFGPDSEYVDQLSYFVDAGKAEVFAQDIGDYFPEISSKKLEPAYAGIRPKLAAEGEPPADFIIQHKDDHGIPGLVQLFGIDSPGLTASLAIGEEIAIALP